MMNMRELLATDSSDWEAIRPAVPTDFYCENCEALPGADCAETCEGTARAERAEWTGESMTVRLWATQVGVRPVFLQHTGDGVHWQEGWFRLGWSDIVSVSADERGFWAYPGPPTHVQVPCTTWGDYVGSAVERSNHRSILTEYGTGDDMLIVKDVRGDYSSHSLVMALDDRIPASLAEQLTKLADEYPLWDEDDHSQLEMELESEMWDAYVYADLRREMPDNLTDAFDETPESTLADWFWEWNSSFGETYCEDAVSASWGNFDKACEVIASRLRGGAIES